MPNPHALVWHHQGQEQSIVNTHCPVLKQVKSKPSAGLWGHQTAFGAQVPSVSMSVCHRLVGMCVSQTCAAGKLYDPSTGLICGLKPAHFVTLATPHMGCDGAGPAQVTYISLSLSCVAAFSCSLTQATNEPRPRRKACPAACCTQTLLCWSATQQTSSPKSCLVLWRYDTHSVHRVCVRLDMHRALLSKRHSTRQLLGDDFVE